MNGTEEYLLNQVKELGAIVGDSEQSSPHVGNAVMIFPGGLDYTLDYCIVGQNQVTIPAKTTNFLQVLFDTLTASWVGSMPTTQPANGVVIDVTKQRLYFSGNFAG